MTTIFDQIISGKVPAAKLYEDDRAVCFLDIAPLRRGHALVVPKQSAAKLIELSPDDAGHLLVIAQRVLPALLAEVGAEDALLAMHDGPAAGQEIPHVHLHVVPRTGDDDVGPVHALFKDRPDPEAEDLDRLAGRVRDRLPEAY